MPRKLIVSLSLILLFLMFAIGAAKLLITLRTPPPRVDVHRPPLLVTTTPVSHETVTEWVEGYGTATADRLAVISAQVAGEIIELPRSLRPGAKIDRGQILLRLDERDYQLALQRAESRLASDRAQLAQLRVEAENIERLLETVAREVESMQWEYEKVKELYEAGSAPKREYAQARRLYEQTLRVQQELENRKALLPQRQQQLEAVIANDEAEIATARLNLERCSVKAPFDGLVQELKVEVGERVQTGTPLIAIIDPRWIDVPVELPLAAHERVRVGAVCELFLESDPDIAWTGEIHRLAPVADERTRTFKAYILVDNQAQLRPMIPGLFLKARVQGPIRNNAILIPRDASRRNRVFVFDPDKNRAEQREIEVIDHFREHSIVTGLQEGEWVITSNLDSLHDGMPVRIESESIHHADRSQAPRSLSDGRAPRSETTSLPDSPAHTAANLPIDDRVESP